MPVQIALGVAAVAIGCIIALVDLSSVVTARLAGGGLVVAGLMTLLDRGRGALWRWMSGALLIAVGLVAGLWTELGVPMLGLLLGIALISYGALSVARALRGIPGERLSNGLFAVATIVLGILSLSWPLLSLAFLRLFVGVWLAFFGLQVLFSLLARRGRAATHQAAANPKQPASSRTRRFWRTTGAFAALTGAMLLTVGSSLLLAGNPRTAPDAFYTPPAQVPDQPGSLLRAEPFAVGVPDGAVAWRILYTTTLREGVPAVSSGLVLAPAAAVTGAPAQDPADESSPAVQPGTTPVISVAHGTTGIARKCAPSLSNTPFADGAGTALVEMVTQHGYVGVISDYVGLGTAGAQPYLVGEGEARGVLDAFRAAHELGELNLSPDTVVWGHSQGGQGSLWTGQIASKYAPEIGVRGVAAFAPASDLKGLAEAIKTTVPGKVVSAYIAGSWNAYYPELKLSSDLTPGSARGVEKIVDLCFNEQDALAAALRGTQIPNQIFPDRLFDGKFGDLLVSNSPTGPFPAPVLVAQGLSDELVLPPLQERWVQARCEAGIEIDFRTFPGLGHVSLVADGSPLNPQLVSWSLDRWAGKPATPNCAAQADAGASP
ncbi:MULTISPECIES: lipase family protein [unclassified Leucobacter]|uniref:lipase family protein n=1 Tax=unclassified Leucobacter TaxID=2621730 RepID=UPI00165EAF23|nr:MULTISPECIES: lipase family protein [unclassified Leucobacter]MBC9935739.1 lipase [Leucobacter sp. cx-87]